MPTTGLRWVATLAHVVAALPDGQQFLGVFVWYAVVVVLALAGFYVAVAVRRWATREQIPTTFTIQDLRAMRARGQISEQEFATMRARLLAQFGRADGAPSSPERPPASPAGSTSSDPE